MTLTNAVDRFRRARGWTQRELARRAGVSRAEISAIENGRGSPSTATALALAAALGRSVEDLFSLGERAPAWAWSPDGDRRFWQANVGGRTLRYPVEPTLIGFVPHDGTASGGAVGAGETGGTGDRPEPTLVIAGCDPAVGLLARALLPEGIRVLALTRSSRQALDLLKHGLVHAAGVHWSEESKRDANAAVVESILGRGACRLLHLARWQEGVVLSPLVRSRSVGTLRRSRIRWVAREDGSGARRCLDRLLGARRFRHVASDHRSVASAIRSGWADAGVGVRLVAEEAGLAFLPVQAEDYELCYAEALRGDPAIEALRRVLCSGALRKRFGELPGYDVRHMGEERVVAR